MLTTANIVTAVFVLAAFGIVRNQIRANGFFAALVLSIGPLIGLLILFGLVLFFGTGLSLAANNFVEQQETPKVQQDAPPVELGTFHDSPADALEHAFKVMETQENKYATQVN